MIFRRATFHPGPCTHSHMDPVETPLSSSFHLLRWKTTRICGHHGFPSPTCMWDLEAPCHLGELYVFLLSIGFFCPYSFFFFFFIEDLGEIQKLFHNVHHSQILFILTTVLSGLLLAFFTFYLGHMFFLQLNHFYKGKNFNKK